MMELVGWSQEDLRAGRINCKSICRPEDFEQDRWSMTQLATTGRVGPAEKLLVRADGEKIPVLISALRLGLNGDENVTFVVDLRPQKQAEEVLRDREARLRAILDTAADAIITIDYSGIIQSVNPATERMFGYTAAEMIGQNVTLLMSSPYREAHDGYIARYLQSRDKHIIGISREIDARRKDGGVFPTNLTVSEIPHLKLFTGVHRDLTQRKQLERDVVEIATLEQQRIGQDLHDDCGQELTALGIMVDSLKPSLDQGGTPDTEVIQKIAQGVQRVLRRVRNLAQGLARVEVEAAELPAALAELASRLSESSRIHFTMDCDEAVPLMDRIRATHLYHIAQEACTNVLRHSRAQNCQASLRATDDGVVLCVRDDGTGMQPDQKPGTGLRIMRNRASVMGARLTIEPAQPSGTLVTCALPWANARAEATRP
jgi:PAS domain S-box-containing protein